MREFILISNQGRTSGNFNDLMKAGRMDIVIHSLINAFFISNKTREDVIFHIFLNGPPDPVKHIEIIYNEDTPFSKKDIGGLIKKTLFKYKKGKKVEVFPGVFIEKRSFQDHFKELKGRNIYVLDKKGILTEKFDENPVFILGDHEGLTKEDKKFIRKNVNNLISLGKEVYFTSQCITILNHYIDKNEEN